MAPGTPVPAATPFLPEGVLLDLLAVSLTGVNVLRPVYNPVGEIDDFAIDYLNPIGQRMTGLAERPGGTLLTHFPHAIAAGILGYYRRVYQAGATDVHEVNYQADGLDNYFRLAARRSGDLLVVSFTDTGDQDRSAVEEVLRQSQAAERTARADAEAQRQRFYEVLMQLPAQVATYQGPEHVFTFVNPRFEAFVPGFAVLGLPLREAAKGAVGAEVFDLFDRVYATGEAVYLPELEVNLAPHRPDQPGPLFVSASYHPLRDGEGHIIGVLDFSYDVTAQVLARQQNEALQAEVLAATRRQVQEREMFYQLFEQTPAAIALLREPGHRIEYCNAA